MHGEPLAFINHCPCAKHPPSRHLSSALQPPSLRAPIRVKHAARVRARCPPADSLPGSPCPPRDVSGSGSLASASRAYGPGRLLGAGKEAGNGNGCCSLEEALERMLERQAQHAQQELQAVLEAVRRGELCRACAVHDGGAGALEH